MRGYVREKAVREKRGLLESERGVRKRGLL